MTIQNTFDPQRETAQSRITILDRTDGGKEFILPALRNFGEKFTVAFIWLVLAACLLIMGFVNAQTVKDLPALVRFVVINHTYFIMGILGLIELLLTIFCLDVWLRSSRIIATAGQLQVITHWVFFKRTLTIPTAKIIELKAENNASVNTTRYYDIVVLATGEKKTWLAAHLPPAVDKDENEEKVFNTGGKRIVAATGIKGEAEAQWLLAQLRETLGVRV